MAQSEAAASAIQRRVRRLLAVRPVNRCDPITLEPLPRRPFLLLSEGRGRHVPVGYDAGALRAYLESTHSPCDPVLRKALNGVELGRLARATGGGPVRLCPLEREARQRLCDIGSAMERAAGARLDSLIGLIERGKLHTFERALAAEGGELRSALATCARSDLHGFTSLLRNAQARLARMRAEMRPGARRRTLLQLAAVLGQCEVRFGSGARPPC